jgi:hypothetical protein
MVTQLVAHQSEMKHACPSMSIAILPVCSFGM